MSCICCLDSDILPGAVLSLPVFPVLHAHFKLDFAVGSAARFTPACSAVEKFRPGIGACAQPKGFIGLGEIPIQHNIMQLPADAFAFKIGMYEQCPYIALRK